MRREDAEALVRLQDESYARAGGSVLSSWPRARAFDADAFAAYLDSREFCVLATSRPDARAQARPVAFAVWNGAFWTASVAGARLRNLRERPWASLIVMDGKRGSHRMVLAEGPVELHLALPDGLVEAWRERHGRDPTWAAAFVELRPERVFSHGPRPG